ncbi:hypothetical protein QCA50_007336 [Cerrena zonata]|uniref:Uncharacterized protein n=1 Tax=Cerrena zonata TaxID=2478898 RepID=A0AAW0GIG8_9APHY
MPFTHDSSDTHTENRDRQSCLSILKFLRVPSMTRALTRDLIAIDNGRMGHLGEVKFALRFRPIYEDIRFTAADVDMDFACSEDTATKAWSRNKTPARILSVLLEEESNEKLALHQANIMQNSASAEDPQKLFAVATRRQQTKNVETSKSEHTDIFVNDCKIALSYFENPINHKGLDSHCHIAIILAKSVDLKAIYMNIYAKALTSDHAVWTIGKRQNHASFMILV